MQEFPDPSFRMLVMQYIQRCGDRRGLDPRLWKYVAYWSLSTFVLSVYLLLHTKCSHEGKNVH